MSDTDSSGTDHEYPTEPAELDAHILPDLADAENGEELWVPVSMIYGTKFRAVKVRVLDRISVNNFEEINATDPWPQSDRLPISHEIAEGNVCSSETGTDQ